MNDAMTSGGGYLPDGSVFAEVGCSVVVSGVALGVAVSSVPACSGSRTMSGSLVADGLCSSWFMVLPFVYGCVAAVAAVVGLDLCRRCFWLLGQGDRRSLFGGDFDRQIQRALTWVGL